MENTELQANDWYDLRNHIDELNAEYVKFKFPESNAPKMNNEVWEKLKASFNELHIDRPLVDLPPSVGKPFSETVSAGWIYVTLFFKSPEHYQKTVKMLNP